MDNLVWKISNVSHFLDLTFDFRHEKWTSQKWCLEAHRNFSQESRVNKRLSILKRTRNRQFLTKKWVFFWSKKDNFIKKFYLKTLIYWLTIEKVINFNNAKNEWKNVEKKSIFFIYFQILFEKSNQSQVWWFSNFLQIQHMKMSCTMQNWLVTFVKTSEVWWKREKQAFFSHF